MRGILALPFGWALSGLYELTDSYLLSIVLLTFVVRLLLLPASVSQQKNSAKQVRLNTKVNKIKQKYAGNQQKIQDYEDNIERIDGSGYGSVWICRHRRDERLLVHRDGGDETRGLGTAALLREMLQGHRRTRHRRHTALTRDKAVRMVMFRGS